MEVEVILSEALWKLIEDAENSNVLCRRRQLAVSFD